MAVSTKKTRTAYYKQAIIKGSKTLSELLHKAFLEASCKFEMTENRHFCPNPSSGDYYVLNELATINPKNVIGPTNAVDTAINTADRISISLTTF